MDRNFDWYNTYYKKISIAGRDGSLGNKLHHSPLERDYKNCVFPRVLELGGGEGEHLNYIKHEFEEWTIVDIRELKCVFEDPRIKYSQADAHSLPFEDSIFDRIVITCLLHHVNEPWLVLEEARRVLKNGGVIDILLPTDPSIIYRFAQFLTTGIRAYRNKVYRLSRTVHSFEHRNHYASLTNIILYTFKTDLITKRYSPFFINFSFLNLFVLYRIIVRKV